MTGAEGCSGSPRSGGSLGPLAAAALGRCGRCVRHAGLNSSNSYRLGAGLGLLVAWSAPRAGAEAAAEALWMHFEYAGERRLLAARNLRRLGSRERTVPGTVAECSQLDDPEGDPGPQGRRHRCSGKTSLHPSSASARSARSRSSPTGPSSSSSSLVIVNTFRPIDRVGVDPSAHRWGCGDREPGRAGRGRRLHRRATGRQRGGVPRRRAGAGAPHPSDDRRDDPARPARDQAAHPALTDSNHATRPLTAAKPRATLGARRRTGEGQGGPREVFGTEPSPDVKKRVLLLSRKGALSGYTDPSISPARSLTVLHRGRRACPRRDAVTPAAEDGAGSRRGHGDRPSPPRTRSEPSGSVGCSPTSRSFSPTTPD